MRNVISLKEICRAIFQLHMRTSGQWCKNKLWKELFELERLTAVCDDCWSTVRQVNHPPTAINQSINQSVSQSINIV